MREGELEGSGGLLGHEGPGLLSAGEGGRMVGSGKHDDTSTGGILKALPPVPHAFQDNKARCLECPLPGQFLTLLGAFSVPVGNNVQYVSSQQQ